jgi:hypothetical protein
MMLADTTNSAVKGVRSTSPNISVFEGSKRNGYSTMWATLALARPIQSKELRSETCFGKGKDQQQQQQATETD